MLAQLVGVVAVLLGAHSKVAAYSTGRQLLDANLTGTSGPNATVTVSQFVPQQSAANPCVLGISTLPSGSVASSPLTVEIQQGQVSLLDISVPAGGSSLEYVNVTSTNATNPALLVNLQAPFNQSAGLTFVEFATNGTTNGDTVTVLAGLFQAVTGSNPLQLDPNATSSLCNLNITFVVVPQTSAPSPSTSTSSSGSGSSSSSGTFPTATGTTTPLPEGIPVTTNNVDGTNRGYGNTGENNIGNGNQGSCNQGDGNIGNNNQGEGNKGNCNIGTGNVGNGWVGMGIINTSTNGPNAGCSCTLNATAGTTG